MSQVIGPFKLPIRTESQCTSPTTRGGVCNERRWSYLKLWICGSIAIVRCGRHAPIKRSG